MLLADRVDARLIEYPRTIHAFLSFAGVLDVAKDAIAVIAATLQEHLASARPWLQHVTVPYEPGRAEETRRFYGELLELPSKRVPSALDGRGFIWFQAGAAGGELHLIPEEHIDRRTERHACLATVRLEPVIARLRAAGRQVELYEVMPDRPQAFVRDPSGILVELTRLPGRS